MAGGVTFWGMREGIRIEVSAADGGRLEPIVAERNSPQQHVWRARIILATAAGRGTAEIMRRAELFKPCVWRWQERFMGAGVAGLLRDRSSRPGLRPSPTPAACAATAHAATSGESDCRSWSAGRRRRGNPASARPSARRR
jgi:hypothetical protein